MVNLDTYRNIYISTLEFNFSIIEYKKILTFGLTETSGFDHNLSVPAK